MSVRLSNISLRAMRKYLQYYGCECTGSKGGAREMGETGIATTNNPAIAHRSGTGENCQAVLTDSRYFAEATG